MSEYENTPKSLKNRPAIEERIQRLNDRHIQPLTRYVEDLRYRYPEWEFPFFDPADGGIDAKLLFIFEKPGPKTVSLKGSGFISRNNNDPTAAATFSFMNEAEIPRKETVIWNAIPGWNGTIKILAGELNTWIESGEIRRLMSILKNIEVIVFVGRKAESTSIAFQEFDKKFYFSPHPSAQVRNRYPGKWHSIPKIWNTAYMSMDGSKKRNL